MATHTRGPVCLGCERKLDEGHDLLRTWFHVAKALDENIHVSWVWRSKRDQELCNMAKTSEALWPTSPHNNMVGGFPYSYAMDLFKQVDGVYYAAREFYEGIAKALKLKGCPLEWGGDWPKRDNPHWQVPKGLRK